MTYKIKSNQDGKTVDHPFEGLKREQKLKDRGNRRRGQESRESRWPGSLRDSTEIT